MRLQIQSYIESYIQSVECMNHLTAEIYSKRINKFNAFAKSEYQTSALTALYKGAIPKYRSQGMPQTKRDDIPYNWRGSLGAWKQRHP
jgi:hypothetical protein